MTAVEIALRAVFYAATLLLFGTSLFRAYAPRRALQADVLRNAIGRMELGCVVAALVSGALGIVVRSAVIGGESIGHTLSSGVLATVAVDTLFGRMSALRLCLIVLFGALLAMRRDDTVLDIARAFLAAAILATLAWTGHAMTLGPGRTAHVAADVLHLLAAGAWVGGLWPLALALASAPATLAIEATRRFSRVGIACVALLAATGIVNAWFLVGRPEALVGTPYGRLLLLKIALFSSMLVIAAVNRTRLMPRMADALGDVARRRISQNARIEGVIGLAIVLIVAALGMTVPAAHMHMVPQRGIHAH